MANKAQTAATFRIIAILSAVFLLAAAALTYLGKTGGTSAELAALSQAVPSQAQAAVSGEAGAFDELSSSASRLASLHRAAGSSAPGSPADWRTLVSQSSAVADSRAEVEAYYAALTGIAEGAASIVQTSDALLDVAGSTALMQQFQQRADRVRQLAGELTQSASPESAITMAEDITFLRAVTSALAGDDSQFDIRRLNNADYENILVPILGALTDIEDQAAAVSANVQNLGELQSSTASMGPAAARLSRTFVDSGGTSMLPSFLQSPWIPLGLIGVVILFVIALMAINAKSSTFEQMAKEQADQNDRNQQAILRLLDEMGSLADGDLTVEATVTEDITGTIADSFNYAIEELRKLVATVNETSIMVDSAAKQTENTAAHMAKAAENQAREINAATESVVSMAASIEEVSGNAERSSDVARHSVEVAHKGGEAVRRTIDGMNAIRETIQDTSKRIKRLGESSQEIGNIVELINDIAEQTNILALNASIQASMAGEAGRGFAVVADEVQRLAERSTNATKQIEVLVRTIQADTNEAVVSMERSTTDVVGGALLAENAGAALDEIEQVSNQIASLVQNISGSARQQAGSAADVTRRTTRLREISEQTGKATTATAAAIAKLSELASQLRKTVAGFTLPSKSMHASTLVATSANISAEQTAAQPANQAAGEQAKTG